MSGLLERSRKDADNAMNQPEEVKEEAENNNQKEISSVQELSSESVQGLPMGLQIGGIVGLLLIAILLFYFKNVNYFLFAILLLGSWGAYAAGENMAGRLNRQKIGATLVVWILVAVGANGASFLIGTSKVTVGGVSIDGTNDALAVKLYGTSGTDFTVDVLFGGESRCSVTNSIAINTKTVNLPLSDCFVDNSQNYLGENASFYTLRATSGENIDEWVVEPRLMNHQANAGLVKITEVMKSENNGDDGLKQTNDAMTVELAVGIGDESVVNIYNNTGSFTARAPLTINTDYTLNIKILFGSNTAYTYSAINVNNGLSTGIVGDFSMGWVTLPGSSATSSDLTRNSFYQEDGCYTFEVTIVNEITGQTVVDDRSSLELFWEENDNRDDKKKPQPC